MKTKMKRQGSTELPRFAVGALAIAGASAANGATVQITFNNSYISSTSGNNIDADFGNDGTAEIVGWGLAGVGSISVEGMRAGTFLGSAYGHPAGGGFGTVGARIGAQMVGNGGAAGVNATVRNLVAVSFTDSSIRSGALTTGYLEMTATATQPGEKRITVNRLIFDSLTGGAIAGLTVDSSADSYTLAPSGGGTSAVPEASSSLGLLALGAGGILTRRRQKRAA